MGNKIMIMTIEEIKRDPKRAFEELLDLSSKLETAERAIEHHERNAAVAAFARTLNSGDYGPDNI